MTRSGLGYGVIVMRVGEPCSAAAEPPEAAIQLRAESAEVITPKLIDGDEDYERWGRRDCGSGRFRGGCLRASYGRCACREQNRSEYSIHDINIRAGQDAGNGGVENEGVENGGVENGGVENACVRVAGSPMSWTNVSCAP